MLYRDIKMKETLILKNKDYLKQMKRPLEELLCFNKSQRRKKRKKKSGLHVFLGVTIPDKTVKIKPEELGEMPLNCNACKKIVKLNLHVSYCGEEQKDI